MKITRLLPAALIAATAVFPACNNFNKNSSASGGIDNKNIDSIVELAQIHLLEDNPQEAMKVLCDNLTDTELLGSDINLHVLGKSYFMLIAPEQMIDTVYQLDRAYRSNSVTVSDDARHMIVSYGASGLSRVYSLPAMELELSAQTPDTLYDAIMSPDSRRVAIGGAGGVFYVYHFPSGELEYRLQGHRGAIRDLTFVGNDTLLSASADHYVRGWELHGGTENWLLHPHTQGINRARVTPDHRMLVTAGDDGNTQLFYLTGGGHPQYQGYGLIKMSQYPIKDAYVSPNLDVLVGGTTGGQVRFYDVVTHEFIGSENFPHAVSGVKINSEGRIVAAVAYDSFHLLNPIKRQHFCSIDLHADSLNSLQFVNSNRIMVADPTRVWFIDIPQPADLISDSRRLRRTLQ